MGKVWEAIASGGGSREWKRRKESCRNAEVIRGVRGWGWRCRDVTWAADGAGCEIMVVRVQVKAGRLLGDGGRAFVPYAIGLMVRCPLACRGCHWRPRRDGGTGATGSRAEATWVCKYVYVSRESVRGPFIAGLETARRDRSRGARVGHSGAGGKCRASACAWAEVI